jgi:sialate O-acetylesterase
MSMPFLHTVRSFFLATTLGLLLVSPHASARVKLPSIFSDHMVLQQKTRATFWGWADPGEKITIQTGWSAKTFTTQTDPSGKWTLPIPTPSAGGPFTVMIKGSGTANVNNSITANDKGENTTRAAVSDSIQLQDVLVGEVWLCSGQSNMVFSLKGSKNAQQEIAAADFPSIRYFSVTRQYATHDFDDSPGATWEKTTPTTAPGFSAVAYFFAKKIHRQLNVPVGIVYSAWGGTPAEAWTPAPVLKNDTILSRYIDRWKYICEKVGKDSVAYHLALTKWQNSQKNPDTAHSKMTDDNYTGSTDAKTSKKPAEPQTLYYFERPWREPGVLFNGMIRPVIPFAIKGVLWYQGESNVNYANEYFRLMNAMIQSWRAQWGTNTRPADFPFYVVQISAFGYSSLDNAARVREAEYEIMKRIPNTGTAVTADLGNMKNIHYTRKEEVGDRLARIALARDYGDKKLIYKGPEAKSASANNGKVTIKFEPSASGLTTSAPGPSATGASSTPGPTLKGFELGYPAPSGDSLLYTPATAKIEGNKIIVWNDTVKNPVEVRYAWLLVGEANLFDMEGLPAFPFRMKVENKK